MLTAEIRQLELQKGLNQLNFFFNEAFISDFFQILLVTIHTLSRKFLKFQMLVAEGFKLSACLSSYNFMICPSYNSADKRKVYWKIIP